MKSSIKLILMTVTLIAASFIQAMAGPTIIRDSRITDTAITPVLGRGYSIGTNTFQSTCMADVIVTQPSYDFTYTFESMEKDDTRTSLTEKTGKKLLSKKSGVRTKQLEYRKRKHWWGGTSIRSKKYRDVYKKMISKVGKTTRKGKLESHSHIINVKIDLTSYYASVDEAKSKLSESASKLLENKDIPGFFNSCGPYYVRSIGRQAIFESFFEYKTKTSERDFKFEGQLEEQIKGFRSIVDTRAYVYRGKRYYSRSDVKGQGEFTETKRDPLKQEFNKSASEKKLTITTIAYGLGKNEKASLISYDIDTFKAAIKDAFLSMQNERTGKVVNMEVVPWVENTQFQNLIELESAPDEYENVLDAAGKQMLDKDGKPVTRLKPKLMLYEKKMLLNENAEFLIEIDRVDRNIMNMYYKAKLCRRNIDMNWKKDGKFKEGLEEALVQNKRNLDDTLPLKQLDETVSKERVSEILNLHKQFMYGDSDKKDGGANACMRAVMKKGIFKVSYRDIKACQPVIENMGEIQNDIIDNYCLPELAD